MQNEPNCIQHKSSCMRKLRRNRAAAIAPIYTHPGPVARERMNCGTRRVTLKSIVSKHCRGLFRALCRFKSDQRKQRGMVGRRGCRLRAVNREG